MGCCRHGTTTLQFVTGIHSLGFWAIPYVAINMINDHPLWFVTHFINVGLGWAAYIGSAATSSTMLTGTACHRYHSLDS